MNELKTEDVMRALECCTTNAITLGVPCRNCPYNECNIVGGKGKRQMSGTCRSWLMKDALALLLEKDSTLEMCAETIKRQDKELLKKDEKIKSLEAQSSVLVKLKKRRRPGRFIE